MTNETCREVSRRHWTASQGGTHEEIRTGCLQRIADATELMAKSYSDVISERDYFKERAESLRQKLAVQNHRIAGLRGALNRIKRAKP